MRTNVRSNPILSRVRSLTMQTAAALKKELRNIEEERKRATAGFSEAAAHIVNTLRRLGYSSNGKSASQRPSTRKKRRIRRTPEQLKREAQTIIQLIKGKGAQGAKGSDVRRRHPKVGPDIRGFVENHGGQKLRTTGTKSTMRYFVG